MSTEIQHSHWGVAWSARAAAFALASILGAIPLGAQSQNQTNIIYTFSGYLDYGGVFQGANYGPTSFKIRMLADTNAVGGTPPIRAVTALQTTIEISNICVVTLLPKILYVNGQTGETDLMANYPEVFLQFYDPAFVGWDLQRPAGPNLTLHSVDGGWGESPPGVGWITFGKFTDVTLTASLLNPLLSITPNGNSVVLQWSTNYPGFQLQSAFNASPPFLWTNITNAPAIEGDHYVLTNSISSAAAYFRLQD